MSLSLSLILNDGLWLFVYLFMVYLTVLIWPTQRSALTIVSGAEKDAKEAAADSLRAKELLLVSTLPPSPQSRIA